MLDVMFCMTFLQVNTETSRDCFSNYKNAMQPDKLWLATVT